MKKITCILFFFATLACIQCVEDAKMEPKPSVIISDTTNVKTIDSVCTQNEITGDYQTHLNAIRNSMPSGTIYFCDVMYAFRNHIFEVKPFKRNGIIMIDLGNIHGLQVYPKEYKKLKGNDLDSLKVDSMLFIRFKRGSYVIKDDEISEETTK